MTITIIYTQIYTNSQILYASHVSARVSASTSLFLLFFREQSFASVLIRVRRGTKFVLIKSYFIALALSEHESRRVEARRGAGIYKCCFPLKRLCSLWFISEAKHRNSKEKIKMSINSFIVQPFVPPGQIDASYVFVCWWTIAT